MAKRGERAPTREEIREMDRLVANVDPRADLPRGFSLWSLKMQLVWLRQHQRKESK